MATQGRYMCSGIINPSDDRCNVCGSLNPTTLLARMRKRDVEILGAQGKIYVKNKGGAPLLQTSGTFKPCQCSCGSKHQAFDGFETKETSMSKFYFCHFTEGQLEEYRALLDGLKEGENT